MSWILLLVFSTTLFKLFGRRGDAAPAGLSNDFWLAATDPVQAVQCRERGYRCPDPARCDCAQVCGSEWYDKIAVLPRDEVIMQDRRLRPGTYCVPRGFETCHQRSSVFVYSASGWYCAPRNEAVWLGDRMVACKNPRSEDDSKNFLMDELRGRPAEAVAGGVVVDDYYEVLPDGSPRFRCVCGSADRDGKRMVSALPFRCDLDHCLRDFTAAAAAASYGWKDGRCECGPFRHLYPLDPTTPCAKHDDGVLDLVWNGRVECMTGTSHRERPLICPRGVTVLGFLKRVGFSDSPGQYLDAHLNEEEDEKVEPKEYPEFTYLYAGKELKLIEYGEPKTA